MMMFYLRNAVDGLMGVRHRVNQIVGMVRANAPVHPRHLSRLPVFSDPQSGGYALEMAGVYEVVSEYYSVQQTEEDRYEVPYKRVYAYYIYDGKETLQEVLLNTVPDVLDATPYFRAVEHLDGMSGTCRYEV